MTTEKAAPQRRLNPSDLKTMQAQGASGKTVFATDVDGAPIDPQRVERIGGAKVTVEGPLSYRMYKKGNLGWYPVSIPANNITMVMGPEGQGNYSWECPDCHGYCGEDGEACPVRGELPYRICPVLSCGKKIQDNPPAAGRANVEHTDAEIIDTEFAESTPALRTKAMLDHHLYTYHPSEAIALAPQSPRNPMTQPPGRMSEVS